MTYRCGLLGRTLKHSYSPAIHEALGGDYSYELFEVEPEDLSEFMNRIDWSGLNVTIPYKQAVIPYCKSLSQTATIIGSVNTILRLSDGSLHGDNTDAAGFLTMLHQSNIAVSGKKVLVLGSGGSSLTVRHVLKEENAGEIVVISRNGTETYKNLDRHKDAQIIVNTTPVGMYPNTGKSPVELDGFPMLDGVLDLIYNPARTRLLMDAEARGVPNIGGLSMLVGQAAAAAKQFIDEARGRFSCFLNVNSSTQQDRGRKQENRPLASCDFVVNLMQRQMENMILIGMPGSGKSVIGQLLAKQLNRPFVDIDNEIEKTAGRTIPEIFEQDGEEYFRKMETQAIERWGKESGLVIATGGGAVTREENYCHMHQNGRIVFIKRDVSKLERSDRPLSQGDMQAMYEQRFPLYKRFADYTVQNERELQDVVDQLVKEWSQP